MLRLTTFGGVRLVRGREDLTGAATQRRRLAILVVLAVAGDRGVSRDKLLALLWPEADSERARHVLNQLLYAQRQYHRSESLFLGKKTLRLNPALIWTDVAAFEAALRSDSLEDATEHYQGPFLDGFFLGSAGMFDEWVERQRERFRGAMRDALARRATRLEAAGDIAGAAEWWRRVAELDPLDSAASRKLVEALATSGDRSAAVRHARKHRDALKTELGLDPDVAFMRLLQDLERPAR